MIYLANAFSLQMLPARQCNVEVTPTIAGIVRALPWTSVVGHADTAAVFADLLGKPVATNRQSVTLAPGDTLVVGQVTGGRLPEGATTLPAGVSIQWMLVRLTAARLL